MINHHMTCELSAELKSADSSRSQRLLVGRPGRLPANFERYQASFRGRHVSAGLGASIRATLNAITR